MPTGFVVSNATQRNALVGLLAPSRDQVGRSFPLAVFAAVPAAELAGRFVLAPLAFRGFLGAAAALLEAAPTLNAAQLTERVRALPRPTDLDWRSAEDERRSWLEQGSSSWLTELTDKGGALGAHYALRTFVTACKERAAEPPRAWIVLSCPLGVDGPSPWLELAGRLLRWKAQPPPFVWTLAEPPRLLLCLGASPGASLSYLARPEASASSLWPLQTTNAQAQHAARDGLSAEHRNALEEKRASMAQLLTSLQV